MTIRDLEAALNAKLSQLNSLSPAKDALEAKPHADSAEEAQRLNDQEIAAQIIDHAGRARKAVLAALERIEDGSYGKCMDCGDDINLLRLRAIPEAELCIVCQVQSEKSRYGMRNGRLETIWEGI